MKFYIKHIILWLKNGNKRTLYFENNKVNIITGKQSTGKSTIIEIIDYCLFANSNNMPEGEIIGDNVEWYGINFVINDINTTIARHQDARTKQYYFSENGNIPQKPSSNYDEDSLKNFINKNFSIDADFIFSKKENKKISAKHFMIFNTQKRDILSNKDDLLDNSYEKKNLLVNELDKVFYLALGISSIENLIKIDFNIDTNIKLNKLKTKIENSKRSTLNMNESLIDFCEEAKKLEIINEINSDDKCIQELEQLIEVLDKVWEENNILFKEQASLTLKINQFKNYKNQYQKYIQLLERDVDSLKPIKYLKENFNELLDDEILDTIVDNLQNELKLIQNHIQQQDIIEITDLQEKIDVYTKDLKNITNEIEKTTSKFKVNSLTPEQSFFLGKVKEKFTIYTSEEKKEIEDSIYDLEQSIKKQNQEINEIKIDETMAILDNLMLEVFQKENIELEGYDGYTPSFDFKKKAVVLKKDEKIIKKIGSSSNHLFLHLVFFNAIHRFFIKKDIPYIPPFLIIDQIDSPYYSTKDKNEQEVFFKALKVLDNQIEYCNNELKKDFQIILFEHVEWENLEKKDFQYYHLVAEWRKEGDGLIPTSLCSPNSTYEQATLF